MKTAKEATTPKSTDPRTRSCIVTREVLPDTELVRFAVGPEGEVVPDLAAKLPGRGMWVRADRDTVKAAAAKGAFARAAKAAVKTDAGLADRVAKGLLGRIKSGLGLAARAGDLVTGFEKVRDALRAGEAGLLVEAADGAADGRDKVFALAHGLARPVAVLGALTGEELSLALGRPNVIHAAVRNGPLAEKLGFDMGRLAGFMPLTPSGWHLPGGAEAGHEAALPSGAA